jgi:hypothetical protein
MRTSEEPGFKHQAQIHAARRKAFGELHFDVHEAVARFFSVGLRYDHKAAESLIEWLHTCGYEICPHDVSIVPGTGDDQAANAPRARSALQ